MGVFNWIEEGRSLNKRHLAMKNILKVVFVIIGTLIGAGFASGQEIYLFFFAYGIEGLIGIILSSLLMGVTIYKTLNIVHNFDVKNYKEYLEVFIRPKKEEKYFNASSKDTLPKRFVSTPNFIFLISLKIFFKPFVASCNILKTCRYRVVVF